MKKILLLIVASVFMAIGCSDSDSDSDQSTYAGSQAPGDLWEYTISQNGKSFIATNYGTSLGEVASATYSGTVTSSESGFLKLTITESSDAGAVGAVSYAIEFPRSSLLVWPLGDTSQPLISCVVKGPVNFSVGEKYIWVEVPNPATWDWDTSIAYGWTEILTKTKTEYSFDNYGHEFDTDQSFFMDDALSAIQGQYLYYPDYATATTITLMTPSGGFAVDKGSNGGSAGLPAPAQTIDIADMTSKEYRGFISYYKNPTDTGAVWSRAHTEANQLMGGFYVNNDIDAGEDTGSILDFSSASQPQPGIITGVTSTHGSDTQHYIFVASRIQGKYVLLGVGRDIADQPFNFFMMEVR
jgi:hypothetical protein